MTAQRTLTMPKLGLTITEGSVAEWPVPVGQPFSAGDILVVVETDKVTNEIEATEAGVITRILVDQGETVDVGTPLAEWESGVTAAPDTRAAPAVAAKIEAALQPPETTAIAPTPLRLKTARRMVEAKQTIPHFYLATKARVDRLEEARREWNSKPGRGKATLTHLLLMSIARAVGKHPGLNRVWSGEAFVPLGTVDVGLAIDTPAGLVAPVLRAVDRMSLAEVSAATHLLVEHAHAQELTADDMGGGMCTLSNAGMHDVAWMASIINPGQAAIFGVGAIQRVVDLAEDGSPCVRAALEIVLSCDHRVLTGVEGATLLKELKAQLENPLSLFAAQ